VPRWLARAIDRGLAIDPQARFPSMDALIRALTPRRSQLGWIVAAAALAVVVGASAAALVVGARRGVMLGAVRACDTAADRASPLALADEFTPVRILPESLPGRWPPPRAVRFEQVDVGDGVACAASTVGVAYCWGRNDRCALGRCRTPFSYRAQLIAVPGRVVEIGAGRAHACARTTERRLFCWGDNLYGQLGSPVSANAGADGLPPDYRDTTDLRAQVVARSEDPCVGGGRCSPAAAEVEPRRRWSALAVGGDHACALAEDDGGIYCWGGRDTAALGADARLVPCESRSAYWGDVRCQPTPVRVPGLPRLIARRSPAAGSGVPVAVAPPDLRGTRVLVSRREVRVVFPRETDGAWGWPGSANSNRDVTYRWSISTAGIMGARDLGLMVIREGGRARDFSSLEALVAEGRAQLCDAGSMFGACTDSGVTASVDSGRVVLVLRDSARIAELFGLRQGRVRPIRSAPEEPFTLPMETVHVEYVAPQIPAPTAALRTEVERRRRPPPLRDPCEGRVAVTVDAATRRTGPAVIQGRVHGRPSFDPSPGGLAGANAYIATHNLSVGTAADGTFELRVPPERLVRPESVTVLVRRVGFRPVSRSLLLREGTRVRLEVALCPETVRLSHD
jgi:hypothetical protein